MRGVTASHIDGGRVAGGSALNGATASIPDGRRKTDGGWERLGLGATASIHRLAEGWRVGAPLSWRDRLEPLMADG